MKALKYNIDYLVHEIESKLFREDDLYELKCLKCGKIDRQLARRPSNTVMLCDCA